MLKRDGSVRNPSPVALMRASLRVQMPVKPLHALLRQRLKICLLLRMKAHLRQRHPFAVQINALDVDAQRLVPTATATQSWLCETLKLTLQGLSVR